MADAEERKDTPEARVEMLTETLMDAARSNFYGSFTVQLQDGQIVHVERSESLSVFKAKSPETE